MAASWDFYFASQSRVQDGLHVTTQDSSGTGPSVPTQDVHTSSSRPVRVSAQASLKPQQTRYTTIAPLCPKLIELLAINPFTPKSDQFQISPATSVFIAQYEELRFS